MGEKYTEKPKEKKRRKGRDITGMRSGKLVALEPTDHRQNNSVVWKCQCDCGKITYQPAYKIIGSLVKSCGCARGESRIKNLTGQRFGRLVALERLPEKYGNSYLWKCQCDCGNIVNVSASTLLSGNRKSCGCLKDRYANRRTGRDITGRRFGRLIAIEPTENREHGSVVWRCQCDCGNEKLVSYNSLVGHKVKSCGCIKKEYQGPSKYMKYVDGTCVENIEFTGLRKDNKSGCTGVNAYRGKWRAVITFKKKTYFLGIFEDKDEAIRVRKEAEKELFGSFLDWYYSRYSEEDRKEDEEESVS